MDRAAGMLSLLPAPMHSRRCAISAGFLVQEFWQVGVCHSNRRRRGFFGLRRRTLRTQAFFDLRLRSNLHQHLFDEMACKSEARIARGLVYGGADELLDLGANRLLETLDVGVGPVQHKIRRHQPEKMKKGGKGNCRRFWKCVAHFFRQPFRRRSGYSGCCLRLTIIVLLCGIRRISAQFRHGSAFNGPVKL